MKDGQCLTSCPLGAYKDNTINQNCLDCPPNCLQCSNNGRKCEICDVSHFRVASGDGKCVQECPEGRGLIFNVFILFPKFSFHHEIQ